MTPTEKHNALARDFVMRVASETKTDSDMMVVVESSLFAAMLILQRQHGVKPIICTEMVDMAVQQAMERFAALQDRRP
jgi:hypothetical protein